MRRVMLAVTASVALAGCNKRAAKAPEAAPPAAVQPVVMVAKPTPAPAPAADEPKAEVKPADALDRMADLGRVMDGLREANGTMPSVEQTLTELRQHPDLFAAVGKGSVILTGTADPAGLWAFAAGAEATGGAVLLGGKAATATAAEVRRHLAAAVPKPAPAVVAQAPPPAAKVKPENAPTANPKPAAPAASPPQPPAANVRVGTQDMEDVRLLIDTASGASGRMPSVAFVQAALAEANSPAAELAKVKAIVLTGATAREGVWAYEAAASTRGGLLAGPGGVETVTADELNRRLAAGR